MRVNQLSVPLVSNQHSHSKKYNVEMSDVQFVQPIMTGREFSAGWKSAHKVLSFPASNSEYFVDQD